MSVKIILGMDELETDQECLDLASKIGDLVDCIKIHDRLYERNMAKRLRQLCPKTSVWIDAKLHDIPSDVRKEAAKISELGADILSVHASGGIDMMKAAVEAFHGKVYAVTILSSLPYEHASSMYNREPSKTVLGFARWADFTGVHGIVCSGEEIFTLAQSDGFKNVDRIVVGVRLSDTSPDDQRRVVTPSEAAKAGATHIVVGRPITLAADPVAALTTFKIELSPYITEKV